MEHSEAGKNFVVERYILGELNETQRDEFENHYFDCPECAEDLKEAAILVANVKTFFSEEIKESRAAVPKRIQWLPFAGWSLIPAVPITGCVILAVLAGYQNLVQIPAMRTHAVSKQLVLTPAIPVRAARAQPGLTFSKRSGIMSVTIAHEWEEVYSRYQIEIERASDHHVISTAEIVATSSDITASAALQGFETGLYFLSLYGDHEGSMERTQVARVPLTLSE